METIKLLATFNDAELKSQSGLFRKSFNYRYVKSLIRSDMLVDHHMGIRSSGSSISSAMRLFIHQTSCEEPSGYLRRSRI